MTAFAKPIGRLAPLVGAAAESEERLDSDRVDSFLVATADTGDRYGVGYAPRACLLIAAVPAMYRLVIDAVDVMPILVGARVVRHRSMIRLMPRRGEVVRARARVVALVAVAGSTGIVIETEIDSDDSLRAFGSMVTTLVLPEPPHGLPRADRAPVFSEPDSGVPFELTLPNDAAQLFGDAVGDHNPIHRDDDAARALGLPGRVLQGMCLISAIGARACALLGFQDAGVIDMTLTRPVAVGSTMDCEAFPVRERSAHVVTAVAGRRVTRGATLVASPGG